MVERFRGGEGDEMARGRIGTVSADRVRRVLMFHRTCPDSPPRWASRPVRAVQPISCLAAVAPDDRGKARNRTGVPGWESKSTGQGMPRQRVEG